MMKKLMTILSLTLIAVLVLGIFAACGGKDTPGEPVDPLAGEWKQTDEIDGTWTWSFDGYGKCTLSCEETGFSSKGTYQLDETEKTVTAKLEAWDNEKVYTYTLTDTTLDLEETYSTYHLVKQ